MEGDDYVSLQEGQIKSYPMNQKKRLLYESTRPENLMGLPPNKDQYSLDPSHSSLHAQPLLLRKRKWNISRQKNKLKAKNEADERKNKKPVSPALGISATAAAAITATAIDAGGTGMPEFSVVGSTFRSCSASITGGAVALAVGGAGYINVQDCVFERNRVQATRNDAIGGAVSIEFGETIVNAGDAPAPRLSVKGNHQLVRVYSASSAVLLLATQG
jgi:hypothetical protein